MRAQAARRQSAFLRVVLETSALEHVAIRLEAGAGPLRGAADHIGDAEGADPGRVAAHRVWVCGPRSGSFIGPVTPGEDPRVGAAGGAHPLQLRAQLRALEAGPAAQPADVGLRLRGREPEDRPAQPAIRWRWARPGQRLGAERLNQPARRGGREQLGARAGRERAEEAPILGHLDLLPRDKEAGQLDPMQRDAVDQGTGRLGVGADPAAAGGDIRKALRRRGAEDLVDAQLQVFARRELKRQRGLAPASVEQQPIVAGGEGLGAGGQRVLTLGEAPPHALQALDVAAQPALCADQRERRGGRSLGARDARRTVEQLLGGAVVRVDRPGAARLFAGRGPRRLGLLFQAPRGSVARLRRGQITEIQERQHLRALLLRLGQEAVGLSLVLGRAGEVGLDPLLGVPAQAEEEDPEEREDEGAPEEQAAARAGGALGEVALLIGAQEPLRDLPKGGQTVGRAEQLSGALPCDPPLRRVGELAVEQAGAAFVLEPDADLFGVSDQPRVCEDEDLRHAVGGAGDDPVADQRLHRRAALREVEAQLCGGGAPAAELRGDQGQHQVARDRPLSGAQLEHDRVKVAAERAEQPPEVVVALPEDAPAALFPVGPELRERDLKDREAAVGLGRVAHQLFDHPLVLEVRARALGRAEDHPAQLLSVERVEPIEAAVERRADLGQRGQTIDEVRAQAGEQTDARVEDGGRLQEHPKGLGLGGLAQRDQLFELVDVDQRAARTEPGLEHVHALGWVLKQLLLEHDRIVDRKLRDRPRQRSHRVGARSDLRLQPAASPVDHRVERGGHHAGLAQRALADAGLARDDHQRVFAQQADDRLGVSSPPEEQRLVALIEGREPAEGGLADALGGGAGELLQCFGELRGRGPALLGLAREAAPQHSLQRVREIGWDRRGPARGRLLELARGHLVEGGPAGQQLVEDHPERVDLRGWARLIPLPQLRGHIVGGPDQRARLREPAELCGVGVERRGVGFRGEGLLSPVGIEESGPGGRLSRGFSRVRRFCSAARAGARHAGEPEVDDLRDPLRGHHHVRELDIPVQDTLLMRGGEPPRELAEDRDRLAGFHRTPLLVQVPARQVLRDQIGAPLELPHPVHRRDVLVLHAGGGAGLDGEAGERVLGLAAVVGGELHGDLAVEQGVEREVDLAHAPLGEAPNQAVLFEELGGLPARRPLELGLHPLHVSAARGSPQMLGGAGASK